MFVPKHFAQDDRRAMVELIGHYGFATLVTTVDGALFATHLPMLLEPEASGAEVLLGHVARANPQWKGFDGETQALAVFEGPHAYVSPTWYTKPEQSVPTWNYAVVHATGSPRVIEDAERTRGVIARLLAQYEGDGPGAWSIDRLPSDYASGQLRGIVAFEMPIDRLQGKFKLNQNKTAEDRRGVITGLRATGRPLDGDVAAMMEKAAD